MPTTVFQRRIDSGSSAFAITPNDSSDLAQPIRGLYIGGAGNIVVLFEGDTSPVTLVGLVAGVVHPLAVKKVFATGTTATSIIGVL